MAKKASKPDFSPQRERIHEIIFEADTPLGKWFDIVLMVLIVFSVIVVMIETVPEYKIYHDQFLVLEWVFTILFTIEYGLRLYCVHSKRKYATSFYGIIDLLSILPTYITFLFAGAAPLMVIRALRLLRVFRIFKMANFLIEGKILRESLAASRTKITIFLFFILLMVTIFGSVMYLVEGGFNESFDSIPRSIYWAIVTLTTVGYGDIAPQTAFGQFLSSIVMIMGYAVIAVPTGIVTAEMFTHNKDEIDHISTQVCRYCMSEGHTDDAEYCKYCGEKLNPEEEEEDASTPEDV